VEESCPLLEVVLNGLRVIKYHHGSGPLGLVADVYFLGSLQSDAGVSLDLGGCAEHAGCLTNPHLVLVLDFLEFLHDDSHLPSPYSKLFLNSCLFLLLSPKLPFSLFFSVLNSSLGFEGGSLQGGGLGLAYGTQKSVILFLF
jgi:hypothetical protein